MDDLTRLLRWIFRGVLAVALQAAAALLHTVGLSRAAARLHAAAFGLGFSVGWILRAPRAVVQKL